MSKHSIRKGGKPRMVRVMLFNAAMMALVGAGVVVCAPEAGADTAAEMYARENADTVCAVLDRYPSFAGIGGIGDAIVNNTALTYYEAGQVIGLSVASTCPWHAELLQDFGRAYATSPVGAVSRRLI